MTVSALVAAARRLAREASALTFGPPAGYVYNPLQYARQPHELYLERFAAGRKRIVLLGMNPGPWGMAQTGVPFGEVQMVSEWLGIRGKVSAPAGGHPRVKVQGFGCARHEVSGTRLWGWMRDRYGTAEQMSRELLVSNYCPLLFLDEAGRNITPDHLGRANQAALFEICDRFLRAVIEVTRPEWLVGIGRFAEARLLAAREEWKLPARVTSILHPSPANPKSQNSWSATVTAALVDQGVWSKRAAKNVTND